MTELSASVPGGVIFSSDYHARALMEKWAWPHGPVCPHCGNARRITWLTGRRHRAGLYQCNAASCRRQFTVTVGTMFADGKLPLHKWLAALYLISLPGVHVSVMAVHRELKISYKSAWFMVRRLRTALGGNEASRETDPSSIDSETSDDFARWRWAANLSPTEDPLSFENALVTVLAWRPAPETPPEAEDEPAKQTTKTRSKPSKVRPDRKAKRPAGRPAPAAKSARKKPHRSRRAKRQTSPKRR